MGNPTIGIATLLIFGVLLITGTRIPIASMLAGFIGAGLVFGWDTGVSAVTRRIFSDSSNYSMTVIPLFLFMGYFAHHAGLGEDMFKAARCWVGSLPAGLAMATTCACTLMGATTGSSTSDAIMFAKVAVPEMDRYGYDRMISVGAVASSGTLAILIPPSVAMVVYGILTEQSIGKLLIAGIVPGLILASVFCLMMYLMALRNPKLAPPGPSYSMREKLDSLRNLWGVMLVIVSVLVGLYAGVVTPTEAGALGSAAMLLVALARRRLTWTVLRKSLYETASMSGISFIILIGMQAMMVPLVATGTTTALVKWVLAFGTSPNVILGGILLAYLIFGCFLSGMGMMIVAIPLIYPVITSLGFDPIWFGIITIVMVEVGLLTPPVGPNVYVTCKVANEPLERGFQAVIPFMLATFCFIGLLVAFPQIVLFLPSLMSK